ncbi:ephrin type-A receptor 5-like [Capsicum annuum]|uniref:ephrin type-A receptor 5-like n=1 Tax=Capsicum annuum TaxID=4072 RepID=UPI001FB0FB26|nr:ephrin type-A receptor 5-like [Capsicum annuum]
MKIGWTSKAKDKILTTDVDDLENNENSVQSPIDNNKINDDNVNMVIDIDRRIGNVNVNSSRKRGTRVSEDGQTDPEARDLNVGSERNGVKVWLNQLGLGQYASLFEIHEVDDEVLPMLTLEDLKDMGISAVGSRRKMYCSIQDLNKDFS